MRTTGLVQQEPEFSGSIEASETLNFEFDFKGDRSELALENFQGNLGKLIFRQRQMSVSRTNILLIVVGMNLEQVVLILPHL